MSAGLLLVRADASVAIGTGHVMRCLALAQAWQDAGGNAVFAAAEMPPALRERLLAQSCEVVQLSAGGESGNDAGQTIDLARARCASWIVVDGYSFGSEFQQALKAEGFKVLFLDDYGHAPHYSADIVLNQNVCASRVTYADRDPQTRLLLGARYSLLRREFSPWREWKREVEVVARRVLVMMGGSDPENITARVIAGLQLAGVELESSVVVGGSNPHFASLQDVAAQAGLKISLLRDVEDLPNLMAAADVAVSAAGSTCWELCLLGLPSLLLDVAPNQTALAKELDRMGCAVQVGNQTASTDEIARALERLCESVTLRKSLSDRCRGLVDGRGAERVVATMQGRPYVHLRRAVSDDRRMLWEWANDPEVRASSFSQESIPWDVHVRWFDEGIADGTTLIFVAEDLDSIPAGQIRFDRRADGEWEVDVSVAKEMRGRGLGCELIRLGVSALRKMKCDERIHALVKEANLPSLKALEHSGFKSQGTEVVRGCRAIHLVFVNE